ncbi:MAG: nucleotide exchange factor GrpE [Blastocatellia bacterium]|nr:nucleotide exchange factor GrpE [Blastocatellia bacterium]
MDQDQEIEELEVLDGDDNASDDAVSVDDFIRELEEKEKDLHITSETTFEISTTFDDANPEFVKIEVEPAIETDEKPDDEVVVAELVESFKAPPAADKEKRLETQLAALGDEVDRLKSYVGELETEREEIFVTSQRRAKDFENYRSRTERERSESINTHTADLAGRMLPALDNLHRALDFAGNMPEEKDPGFAQFFTGIELVGRQLESILGEMGIEHIAAVGTPFDPIYHEAVAVQESDEHPDNTICEELIRGYRVGDRVLRHSMVKVWKAPAAKNERKEAPLPEPAEFEFETFARPAEAVPTQTTPENELTDQNAG